MHNVKQRPGRTNPQNPPPREEGMGEPQKPKVNLVKKSMCSASYLASAIKTLGLVIFYFTFSISLTFYNQKFIKAFHYPPLTITMTHLVFKFMSAGVVRSILECRKKEERVTLCWTDYVKRVAPTGIVSALDIGLSNWSFEFITVSLYTMSKSTAIIFILGFSILLRLEKFRWSLVMVILCVAVGLFLFTYKSTQFNLEGFLMVITASFLSGLRWTLAQLVTQKQEVGLGNPLDMMYHVQPWMIVGLFPLSAAFEGMEVATREEFFRCEDLGMFMTTAGLLLAGASLAFMLEFSEFLLLSQTSSLTLSLSGIVKEICTLGLAAEINGDLMNSVNVTGLFVCLCGITLHVVLKAVYNTQESKRRVLERTPESVEMLTRDGEANADDEVDLFNVKRDR
ncbi:solute carrier family 35 member C2-like isoform X1 [Haliotis rufescens]|uniref:solute carrier family 35 member C2-like isoform X1 n=2 Tax=Haliotis rufescens TaxID=6454 RepID=UPI00201F76AF|nr:solute carrier family 35 member C2-like isoform X1 [Haliotis rufescens]